MFVGRITAHIVGQGLKLCRGVLEGLSYLVYPPFCLVCERDLTGKEHLVCERCWSSVEMIDRPFCLQCGAPLPSMERSCLGCRGKRFHFSGVRAAFRYTEDVRKVIHAFKFHRKTSLARRLGRTLAFAVIQDVRFGDVDCLVPVPLHPSRLRERGYNQSDLLAEAICAELGIVCMKNALIRTKRTRAQTALNPQRRQRNVEKAFAVVHPTGLVGKKVALVDDVFTTGATVEACAQALRDGGAADVTVLTVARAW